MSAPTGGMDTATMLVDGQGAPISIAVTDNHIYWVNSTGNTMRGMARP